MHHTQETLMIQSQCGRNGKLQKAEFQAFLSVVRYLQGQNNALKQPLPKNSGSWNTVQRSKGKMKRLSFKCKSSLQFFQELCSNTKLVKCIRYAKSLKPKHLSHNREHVSIRQVNVQLFQGCHLNIYKAYNTEQPRQARQQFYARRTAVHAPPTPTHQSWSRS